MGLFLPVTPASGIYFKLIMPFLDNRVAFEYYLIRIFKKLFFYWKLSADNTPIAINITNIQIPHSINAICK